ncbi:hypothetical protein Tco_0269657 [Tanacetum coccineum]
MAELLLEEKLSSSFASSLRKKPLFSMEDIDEESSIPLRDLISELPLSVAITPNLPITDYLIMDDEHLNTITKTESDEENESSVENLIPSESEDLSEYLSDIEKIDEADFDPEEEIRLIEKLF